MDILRRFFSICLLSLVSFSLYAEDVARIWVEKDTVFVGKVDCHVRSVTIDIPVYNTGDAPLKISEIGSDCICTQTKYDKEPIPAASNKTISVSIDIRKYFSGEMEKSIFIMSNATEPKKAVTFVINVVN